MLNFIDFHWFSMIFWYFHWLSLFSLLFTDFQWFSMIFYDSQWYSGALCFLASWAQDAEFDVFDRKTMKNRAFEPPGAPWGLPGSSLGLLSFLEPPWEPLGTKIIIFNDIHRLSIIFIDFQWFNDFHWLVRISLIFIEFLWFSDIFIDFHCFPCCSQIFNDFQWFSMILNDIQWCSLIFNDFHFLTMSMIFNDFKSCFYDLQGYEFKNNCELPQGWNLGASAALNPKRQ